MLKGEELKRGVFGDGSSQSTRIVDPETANLGQRRYGGVKGQERMNLRMEAILKGS
jgi:hypothetical protein